MVQKTRQGFTLLEILAVIALILLVSSMAIPMYNDIVNAQRVKVDAATALQLVETSKTYYIQEKDTDTYDSSKVNEYIKKVYGEIPKSKSEKDNTFFVKFEENGEVNVSLQPSGITVVTESKVDKNFLP